jgi:hypothetical protein
MSEQKKPGRKAKRKKIRRYEAEAQGLLSLRLIAAPNPKDDLSDSELKAFCGDPRQSPELIRLLIDAVKSL